SCVGVEDHRQPRDGTFVEVPLAAHITDPGGKVGNHDQLLSQVGEVGDKTQVHHTSRTFTTRKGMRRGGGKCLRLFHLVLNASCPAKFSVFRLITCHSSGGQ